MSDDWGNDPIVQAAAPAAAPQSGSDWGNDPVVGAKNYKFSDKAISSAINKPGTIVRYMSPAQYLALTPDLPDNTKTDKKGASLKKSLDKGEDVDEVPSLDVTVGKDGAAKVVDQDGRHRAQFAKDAGVDLIPVAVQRSGEKGIIKNLSGMKDGSEPVPFDFKPVLPPIKQGAAAPAKPLLRWDVLGDIGRAATSSVKSLKQDIRGAAPSPDDLRAEAANDTAKYGPGLATLKEATVDPLRRAGNALKTIPDALGVALSPVAGVVHGLGGSVLASAQDAVDRAQGYQPRAENKEAGDLSADILTAGIFPEEAEEVAATRVATRAGAKAEAQTGNALAKVQNLKPGAAAAHKAGYVLPPAMAKESTNALEDIAGGLGGKVKLQQLASAKNQPVTTSLAKTELGLHPDTELTDKAFKDVREDAGKTYKAIEKAMPEMAADKGFKAKIKALGVANTKVAEQFPDVLDTKAVDEFVANMSKVDKFSPETALFVVRKLRSDAVKNMNAPGDPSKGALGLAQRKAADELDDLMERNLESIPNVTKTDTGSFVGAPIDKSSLVADYRKARQTIAKSYDIQGATKNGEVSAAALAKLANKGRPLTGNLKTIADTANAFPKAVQNPAAFGGAEPYSALDAFAALGATAAGDYKTAATIASRPLVRGGLLSKGYQDRMIPNIESLPSRLGNAVAPPSDGLALVHNAPLPGVQNQLAKGIFRAAHVNGLRALVMPRNQPVAPSQGQ